MTDAPRVEVAPAVALRTAVPGDREFLARVYASTREQELKGVPFSPEEKAGFLEHQFTAQSLHYERYYFDTTFDVILVDGEPAGRLIVGRWHDQIRIVDIAILPEYRGRGVGTQVLGPMIDEADERGVPTTIHVERFNPAQSLYRRLGFAPTKEDENGIHRYFERPPTAPG